MLPMPLKARSAARASASVIAASFSTRTNRKSIPRPAAKRYVPDMDKTVNDWVSPPCEVSLPGPFRYKAFPRIQQRNADGTRQDVPLPPCYGATAEAAVAKAQKALENWKAGYR